MKPRAFLLGRPQFDEAYLDFLAYVLPPEQAFWTKKGVATPAEWLIEFAGRVCYMSFGSQQSAKTTGEYIQNLIRNGHESVLEHAVWSFALVGISRAFTHQLVRHRVGFAFSQLHSNITTKAKPVSYDPMGSTRFPKRPRPGITPCVMVERPTERSWMRWNRPIASSLRPSAAKRGGPYAVPHAVFFQMRQKPRL